MCGMPSAVEKRAAMPARAREQADGQVGARAAVVQRVEAALGQRARRRRPACRRARARRPTGFVLVEPQHVQELLLELGQRGVGLEVGVHELGPGRRRAGQDRPVELAAADDLAGLADRGQAVAAGAHRVEVVEQARGDRAGERDRGAALAAEREDALAVPRRDELERVVGRVLDPRALDPRVEPGEVDELRALARRRARRSPGRAAPCPARRSARRSGRAGRWRRSRRRARRSGRE